MSLSYESKKQLLSVDDGAAEQVIFSGDNYKARTLFEGSIQPTVAMTLRLYRGEVDGTEMSPTEVALTANEPNLLSEYVLTKWGRLTIVNNSGSNGTALVDMQAREVR